jgi:hypothetical protein
MPALARSRRCSERSPRRAAALLLVVQSHLKAIQISRVREPTPGGHFFDGSAPDRQQQASAAGGAADRAHAGDCERAYPR